MTRQARSKIGDVGLFHVYNRGNNADDVYHDDDDFFRFIALVGEVQYRFGLHLFHYVVMPNHYHLLLKNIHVGALSLAMKHMNQTYSLWHKNKYGGLGHLWQGRFKYRLIDNEKYFYACSEYIKNNPVRAGLCQRAEDYRWSSFNPQGQSLWI